MILYVKETSGYNKTSYGITQIIERGHLIVHARSFLLAATASTACFANFGL